MTEAQGGVLSIGHSSLPYGRFLELLRAAGATAIADVRSAPYSRHHQQYNREPLHKALKVDGIAYVWLGLDLGGRPSDATHVSQGIADYERMAKARAFERGLSRVIEGGARHRIALMCAEKDPLNCHRCLLVGRSLKERGIVVHHILQDGGARSQADIEDELLKLAGADANQVDLFVPYGWRLDAAYRLRARRVAFADAAATGVTAAE
jgi:uncharacterized protein (DUF488 family)